MNFTPAFFLVKLLLHKLSSYGQNKNILISLISSVECKNVVNAFLLFCRISNSVPRFCFYSYCFLTSYFFHRNEILCVETWIMAQNVSFTCTFNAYTKLNFTHNVTYDLFAFAWRFDFDISLKWDNMVFEQSIIRQIKGAKRQRFWRKEKKNPYLSGILLFGSPIVSLHTITTEWSHAIEMFWWSSFLYFTSSAMSEDSIFPTSTAS